MWIPFSMALNWFSYDLKNGSSSLSLFRSVMSVIYKIDLYRFIELIMQRNHRYFENERCARYLCCCSCCYYLRCYYSVLDPLLEYCPPFALYLVLLCVKYLVEHRVQHHQHNPHPDYRQTVLSIDVIYHYCIP